MHIPLPYRNFFFIFAHTMKRLLIISLVFLALAGLFFSPVQSPGQLAYPVAFLGLMELTAYRHTGIWMACGLVLSALGDWQGTQGNFLGQMALFGLAHIAYICYFARRLQRKSQDKAPWMTVLCVLIGLVALISIVPRVPTDTLRTAVTVYCVLILTMLRMALQQRDSWFALGAALFVLSDFILAWNRFVSPVAHATWLIMIPYYAAQWLIFFRASTLPISPREPGTRDTGKPPRRAESPDTQRPDSP